MPSRGKATAARAHRVFLGQDFHNLFAKLPTNAPALKPDRCRAGIEDGVDHGTKVRSCAVVRLAALLAATHRLPVAPATTGISALGQARPREIGQRPQSADRKNNAGFSRVVGAGGRGGLAGFVPQKNLTLPIVKVGKPDAVGKLQNGDEFRHAWEPLPRRATGFKTVRAAIKVDIQLLYRFRNLS